jgi:hypothetical protein
MASHCLSCSKSKAIKHLLLLPERTKAWYNIAGTYARDCDYYFDGMDAQKHYFKDDRVVLEGIENGQFKEDNNFFYLHLQSPHETALLQNEFASMETLCENRRKYKRPIVALNESLR